MFLLLVTDCKPDCWQSPRSEDGRRRCQRDRSVRQLVQISDNKRRQVGDGVCLLQRPEHPSALAGPQLSVLVRRSANKPRGQVPNWSLRLRLPLRHIVHCLCNEWQSRIGGIFLINVFWFDFFIKGLDRVNPEDLLCAAAFLLGAGCSRMNHG